MLKRLAIIVLTLVGIASLALLVISYGRGYRIDFQRKSLNSTGILSVSSYPEKASIFINGKLTSATNANITLPPDWYDVKITKEGYQPWEKKVRIQGEVVSQIDALLTRSNPSLRSLTSTGIVNPNVSPSKLKVAFFIKGQQDKEDDQIPKEGLYIMELKDTNFLTNTDSKRVYQTFNQDIETAKIHWSPKEDELMILFYAGSKNSQKLQSAIQVDTENPSILPKVVTGLYEDILAQWNQEREILQQKMFSIVPKTILTIIENSADRIEMSPDETKILYIATDSASLPLAIEPPIIGGNPTEEERSISLDKYYVYDIKEDKNFKVLEKNNLPQDSIPIWYMDSKHIVFTQDENISIIDYDGTNLRSVYSGPFVQNVVYPWNPGGKIVILTNFNTATDLPNLYEVDLR